MMSGVNSARRFMVGALVAMVLATLPPGWQDVGAVAADTCSRVGELRATTCRLISGQAVEDGLASAVEPTVYRVEVLTSDTKLDLTLTGTSETATSDLTMAVLNWRGEELASATGGPSPEAHLSTSLPLPGTYGVRLTSADPTSTISYRLLATIEAADPTPRIVWPPSLTSEAGSLVGERQVIRTPRGGTPEGGVALARALGAPPAAEVSDFTLVADVDFGHIVGPSALTVRFRYEPEAGGGSGYLFLLDPFAGEAYLDSFEEGQRHSVVPRTRMPLDMMPSTPRRLVLRASGSEIVATLDGQELLRATDGHYARGLVAVGAVTWSEPVVATFDHLLVLTPGSQ